MLKRLVILLAVLAGLAALADRGLAALAGNAVAVAVQRSENLSEKPDVTFKGFPFLTQAFGGRFEEVDVTVRDVRREGVTVTRIDATLTDVEVGLGDALSGEVEAVPVGDGSAVAQLSYADVNEFLAGRPGSLRVSGASGRLTVRGTVGSVPAEGTGAVSVRGDTIVVAVTNVRAVSGPALPAAAAAGAASRFSFTVPVRGVPFGIRLLSVAVGDDGLRVAAAATGIVIRAR